MLTHHRLPVHMSLISTDLPVWSVIETAATLYQKESDRFHLLLKEPIECIPEYQPITARSNESSDGTNLSDKPEPSNGTSLRLLWLELSPYRVIMTMQSQGKFGYRHFWEQGIYGTSRYWFQDDHPGKTGYLRLQNFTRSLVLQQSPLPTYLRVDYELWSDKVAMGRYVLNIDIQS